MNKIQLSPTKLIILYYKSLSYDIIHYKQIYKKGSELYRQIFLQIITLKITKSQLEKVAFIKNQIKMNEQINIVFEKEQRYEINDNKIKNYCLFSIIKPLVTCQKQNIHMKNKIQTFLLVNVQTQGEVQNNLILNKIKKNEANIALTDYKESKKYSCNFLRYANLGYCKKLSQLLSTLNMNINNSMQNQWFVLYQVKQYELDQNYLKQNKMKIQIPSYGQQVLVIFSKRKINSLKNNKQNEQKVLLLDQKLRIGNLFRHNQQNFYFLSSVLHQQSYSNLQLITSLPQRHFIGFSFKLPNTDTIILLPLYTLLHESKIPLNITPSIKQNLLKTCHVQYLGNYCTGILISQKSIITTRHLLPGINQWNQNIMNQINVRRYPFREIEKGIVIKIGLGSLDIMEIEIQQKGYMNKQRSNNNIGKNKEKMLVKYQLNQQINNHKYNQAHYNKDKYQQQYSSDHSNQINRQQLKNSQYSIGQQIFAIGFGKFSYPSHIFSKFQLCLPTISTGIISKLISFQPQPLNFPFPIYLKSDMKLYSGFSGSGLWKFDCILGMAVFILKNKNSNSKYHKHNFSYTIEFINKLLINNKKKQLIVGFNKELEEFDQVKTRKRIKIKEMPKL